MASPGAWVSHPVTAEKVGPEDIGVFSSEIAALRVAVRVGHDATFVAYGSTLAQAIAAKAGES